MFMFAGMTPKTAFSLSAIKYVVQENRQKGVQPLPVHYERG